MNIEGVVLAAGFSRRTGVLKMGLLLEGKTLIEKSIEGMYDICSRIIVVGGYKIEKITEIMKGYPKIEVFFNRNYTKGMFSSVKEGVRHVKSEKFFLLPGDYPLISQKTYKKMLDIEGEIVIPVNNGRKGHPVLMKSSLIEELQKEPINSTLKDFINRKGYTPVDVEDNGILVDIDSMEDYREVLSTINKKYR